VQQILVASPLATQQKMSTSALRSVATLCSLSGIRALSVLRATTRNTHQVSVGLSTLSGEWKACLDAEAEDTHFWSSEWQAMESELLQLQSAVSGQPNATNAIGTKSNVTVGSATTQSQPAKHAKHFNPLAGLKLNLEPKSPADLIPALSMLKGLYEDGKERIGKLNAREQEFKKQYMKKQATHEQRLKTIADRVKNGTLSKEFAVNETRDETRLWTYWERVRERQHRQYHTSLKIQHGTLTKEKQMIDMYDKTIAGKESKKQLAKEFSKVGGPAVAPEVVFFQEAQRGVAKFCQEELAEVRREQVSLLQSGLTPSV